MKKKLLITSIIIVALLVPFSAFAATSNGNMSQSIRNFFGIDVSELSDSQKTVINEYAQKIADTQKEFINKMVENETITKEQGDEIIAAIESKLENSEGYSFLPGFRKVQGSIEGNAGKGIKGIDVSSLTEQQKEELTNIYNKAAEAQKSYINKIAANGLITEVQAKAIISKIDNLIAKIKEDNFSGSASLTMSIFSDFDCFCIRIIDESNLTEQQKADKAEFETAMSELKKEFLDKLVSFGLITSEQEDTIINQTGGAKRFNGENGFSKGSRKGKGVPSISPNNNGTTESQSNTPSI